MTYILITSLINLCLIFAVWRCWVLTRNQHNFQWKMRNSYAQASQIWHQDLQRAVCEELRRWKAKMRGGMDRVEIKAKVAEKMADRAFNMASTANLGVVALQKALVVPRLVTKQQGLQNQLAKNGVDKLFNSDGGFDWLYPILSDEERELVDQAREFKEKMETKK